MARVRVLLDSTYVLPAFGIAVRELSREDLLKLEELRRCGAVEYCYSNVMWVEVVPKVVKEHLRNGRSLDFRLVERAVEALHELFSEVEPGPRAICEAFKLRSLGHVDMVDNILYGIAIENDMHLLSMDCHLREFLKRHGLRFELIVDHHKLFSKISF